MNSLKGIGLYHLNTFDLMLCDFIFVIQNVYFYIYFYVYLDDQHVFEFLTGMSLCMRYISWNLYIRTLVNINQDLIFVFVIILNYKLKGYV